MDIAGETEAHSHGAQWGIVVEGEMELTIDGGTKIYRKGDYYYIPDGPHILENSTPMSTRLIFSQRLTGTH